MPLPIADIALDLGNVLLFFFKNDIHIRGREVVAMTLSLSSAVPKTLLMVLVFFAGLALMGGLPTRHVNREKINGLSPSGVLLLLFCKFVLLETPGIHLASI